MLTVIIQAGGESRRMGQDKALIPFLGKPLISRVIERISTIADEIVVTTNRPEDLSFLGLPTFQDIYPGRGALGGLFTALSAASQPLAAVIACDMPFVDPELIRIEVDLLIEKQVDAVVPHTGDGVEPFHAVYRPITCLPHIQKAIEKEKWRADAWFSEANIYLMRLEEIRRYDPEMMSFSNVNTPEELQAAEKIARKH